MTKNENIEIKINSDKVTPDEFKEYLNAVAAEYTKNFEEKQEQERRAAAEKKAKVAGLNLIRTKLVDALTDYTIALGYKVETEQEKKELRNRIREAAAKVEKEVELYNKFMDMENIDMAKMLFHLFEI